MTAQQKKARAFAAALAEWDAYKAEISKKLAKGEITEQESERLLSIKANELDL